MTIIGISARNSILCAREGLNRRAKTVRSWWGLELVAGEMITAIQKQIARGRVTFLFRPDAVISEAPFAPPRNMDQHDLERQLREKPVKGINGYRVLLV